MPRPRCVCNHNIYPTTYMEFCTLQDCSKLEIPARPICCGGSLKWVLELDSNRI